MSPLKYLVLVAFFFFNWNSFLDVCIILLFHNFPCISLKSVSAYPNMITSLYSLLCMWHKLLSVILARNYHCLNFDSNSYLSLISCFPLDGLTSILFPIYVAVVQKLISFLSWAIGQIGLSFRMLITLSSLFFLKPDYVGPSIFKKKFLWSLFSGYWVKDELLSMVFKAVIICL